MIKFTKANRSPLYIATDENGKKLYGYFIEESTRTIKKILVYDKSVDTFELPNFNVLRSDINVRKVFSYLGWPLFKNQKILMDKYLSGSIKIAEGCFDDLKKVTLIVHDRYSIYLNGERYNDTYIGAFNGKVDVTLKLPNNLTTYTVEKNFALRTGGKNVPGMVCRYTLIADKRLGKISEFDTIGLNDPDDSVTHLYNFQQCKNFPIKYFDQHDKEIENS